MPDQNTTREIPLTQGKVAIVDAEDYERVSAFNWKAECGPSSIWYARRCISSAGKRKTVLLHRFVLGLPEYDPRQVDHEDHDGLNCQKTNLRLATCAQNQYNAKLRKDNTSGFKGVRRIGKRWGAFIKINKRESYQGLYDTREEAARKYDEVAKATRGEFACLNFPEEKQS